MGTVHYYRGQFFDMGVLAVMYFHLFVVSDDKEANEYTLESYLLTSTRLTTTHLLTNFPVRMSNHAKATLYFSRLGRQLIPAQQWLPNWGGRLRQTRL